MVRGATGPRLDRRLCDDGADARIAVARVVPGAHFADRDGRRPSNLRLDAGGDSDGDAHRAPDTDPHPDTEPDPHPDTQADASADDRPAVVR